MPDHNRQQPPGTSLAAGPPLAKQLQATAQCVLAVQQGQSLSKVLQRVAPGLRPGVQALSFHVLRHLGTARALQAQLARKAPPPPASALLHSALALLLGDEQSRPYATHTLVDQAVEAARGGRDTQAQAGFINACLRRYLREAPALLKACEHNPEVQWNHPAWWVERVRADHPSQWERILRANQQPGPMSLRVNRRQLARDTYRAHLKAFGCESELLGTDGLMLSTPISVEGLPGYAEGHFSVQDAAAQRAAELLLDGRTWRPTDRVLDACAAPGGKTAHLLERADLDLIALDVDPQRCQRIHENLQRLRLQADVRCADAADTDQWWDGRAFDAILLDAPCTASGIVRRHPDVRWLRRESDISALAAVQQRLLERLWPLLKPGGRFLYATCSVFRAEGDEQVQAFVDRHPDARWLPSPGHLLPGPDFGGGDINDNVPGGYDGFYYARLDKAED